MTSNARVCMLSSTHEPSECVCLFVYIHVECVFVCVFYVYTLYTRAKPVCVSLCVYSRLLCIRVCIRVCLLRVHTVSEGAVVYIYTVSLWVYTHGLCVCTTR